MGGRPGQEVSTLVLGIGNLLKKDDGIGIHILNILDGMDLPEGVGLLDGGTAGIDIVPYLENIRRLIIVDALLADGAPGEIRIIQDGEIPAHGGLLAGHSGGIEDILDMAAALWNRPETTVVGVIPADCESYEIGLSPELSGIVLKAADIIIGMVGGAKSASVI